MATRFVIALMGLITVGLGFCMLAPAAVGLLYHEPGWTGFLHAALICVVLGFIIYWIFREPNRTPELGHKQGMGLVALAWAVAGLLGGVGHYLSGDFLSFTDAVFESVSGFTTTGASVLTDIEGSQKCVLFWRSLTHWLGGMGFIVLGVAILPFVGVGGMSLYKAEVPSPTPDKLAPRITDTALVLWKVYAVITLAETLLLMAGGLDWFEAINHAFATMATGGFSTKNASVAGYHSAYVEWIITIFMFIAGMNFTLHYQFLWKRDLKAFHKDEECRFYLFVSLAVTLVIAASLMLGMGRGLEESLRLAAFQVATILTTTGFATEDYSLWPSLALCLLILLMFVGGSAGSTGGGPKVMRVMVVLKQAAAEFQRLLHPRVVAPVKMGGHSVDKGVVSSIYAFMGLYFACFVATGIIMSALGLPPTEAFFSSIACLGNIGPGLGTVGPAGNYAAIPALGKWVLSVAMIVGRLEVYTVLVILLPEFWRK